MKADRETFIERINVLGRDALLTLAVSLYDKMEEMRLQHLENDRISTEAHIQFSELHEKYTAVLSENEELKVLYKEYLGEVGGHKAHHLLHTTYVARDKYENVK